MAKSNGNKTTPTELSLCYVPCRVEPGMFRGEYLAYLEAFAPDDPNKKAQAQLLVDEREVAGLSRTPKRHDPVNGWLRVTLLRQVGEWAEVVLPQPSQPFGERVLVAGEAVRGTPGP